MSVRSRTGFALLAGNCCLQASTWCWCFLPQHPLLLLLFPTSHASCSAKVSCAKVGNIADAQRIHTGRVIEASCDPMRLIPRPGCSAYPRRNRQRVPTSIPEVPTAIVPPVPTPENRPSVLECSENRRVSRESRRDTRQVSLDIGVSSIP